jgi:hypothetical protein
MMGELVIGAGVVTVGGVTYARRRRVRLYGELAGHLAPLSNARVPHLRASFHRTTPDFSDRLAVAPDLLRAETFATLKTEAECLVAPERSFVPTHKKGGTVAYETLIASAPDIVALYHSADLKDFISRLVGVEVKPTPIHDQSSLSVLFYDKPGDHIGWHYDHNFYRGRHFTVLIALTNQGAAAGGHSHAELCARIAGRETAVSTAPNTAVVFEGARIHHKVTPIRAGERRLILSMTYCTDPRSRWWQGGSRRIKDTSRPHPFRVKMPSWSHCNFVTCRFTYTGRVAGKPRSHH